MSNENKNLIPRPPVVVIMGHIDHGKSTLLDYIRKTNKTEKEMGGITQHISAYESEYEIDGKMRKITFLDTPGHEAFSSMRERGTKVADIAVLVVSAEDGVKPQTIEALDSITQASIPFIVAINKIDKAGVNIDKVKQSLAENNILVEGWGGTIPTVSISAKTGQNIPELLEMIALQSDLEELAGDPSTAAEGFVIESDLNPQQGISATLIIKNGSLKIGTFVYTNWAYTKVKSIENYKGENIKEASFSSPIKIVGWSAMPSVGSKFHTFPSKEETLAFAKNNKQKEENSVVKNPATTEETRAFLLLVIKADTFGSLNALEQELQKLGNEKIKARIISKGIGTITEQDIKTANIKKSLVLGFNVEAHKSTEMFALRNNIEIKTFKVIYDLVDYVKEKIKSETPFETIETLTGSAKVLRNFSKNKDKQVVGGRVEEGEIKSGTIIKIFRRDIHIGEGKIKEMQIQKIKTDIIKNGQEFGMMIESKIELVGGDVLKAVSLIKQQ